GFRFDLSYFNNATRNLFTLNSITGNAGGGVLNQSNNANSTTDNAPFGITPGNFNQNGNQQVNFPLNYWGAANGPSGSVVQNAGAPPVATTFFGGFGSGQSVTPLTPAGGTSVDVTPFLTDATNFIPTPGATNFVPGV